MLRALSLLLAVAAAGPAAASPLVVTFLDVGQGDATLIESPTGKTVLVDGGPPESAGRLARALAARLHGPLDLVVLTHRHLDHLGGLGRVLATVGARQYLDSGFAHDSPAYRALLAVLAARHIPIKEALPGRRIDLGGGATLELLGPPDPPLLNTRSDVNANSIVTRLDYGRASLLLAADAEAPTERWLLRRHARLDARVLKVAHHGSHHSSSVRFLRAVHADVAVVSVGARNDYRHPSAAVLARLAASRARVYRTDRDGDIRCSSDGAPFVCAPVQAALGNVIVSHP